MTEKAWRAEVKSKGGVVTAWPFAGIHKGAMCARFPADLAPKGSTKTKSGLWAYQLAPLSARLGETIPQTFNEGVAGLVGVAIDPSDQPKKKSRGLLGLAFDGLGIPSWAVYLGGGLALWGVGVMVGILPPIGRLFRGSGK